MPAPVLGASLFLAACHRHPFEQGARPYTHAAARDTPPPTHTRSLAHAHPRSVSHRFCRCCRVSPFRACRSGSSSSGFAGSPTTSSGQGRSFWPEGRERQAARLSSAAEKSARGAEGKDLAAEGARGRKRLGSRDPQAASGLKGQDALRSRDPQGAAKGARGRKRLGSRDPQAASGSKARRGSENGDNGNGAGAGEATRAPGALRRGRGETHPGQPGAAHERPPG